MGVWYELCSILLILETMRVLKEMDGLLKKTGSSIGNLDPSVQMEVMRTVAAELGSSIANTVRTDPIYQQQTARDRIMEVFKNSAPDVFEKLEQDTDLQDSFFSGFSGDNH